MFFFYEYEMKRNEMLNDTRNLKFGNKIIKLLIKVLLKNCHFEVAYECSCILL